MSTARSDALTFYLCTDPAIDDKLNPTATRMIAMQAIVTCRHHQPDFSHEHAFGKRPRGRETIEGFEAHRTTPELIDIWVSSQSTDTENEVSNIGEC